MVGLRRWANRVRNWLALNRRVVEQRQRLGSLAGEVKVLRAALDDVAREQALSDDLTRRVAAVESAVKALEGRTADLKSTVDELQRVTIGLLGDVVQLSRGVPQFKEKL